MTNFKHLLEEQREIIQYMINNKYSFTDIGKSISKSRRAISYEVQRNRYIRSSFFDMFDQKGIKKAISDCIKLQKPPYVCNSCPVKLKCCKHKLYYNSKLAQKNYEEVLKTSHEGIDITLEVVDEIEQAIVPLIKNKRQSINQVYINHSDILYFSKSTFYRYIDLGVISLTNFDLPKKVKYRKRKKTRDADYKRKLALLKGRTYKEYLDFILKHPRMNIVEMDTVEGTKSSSKVLLTIIIKETRFMLIFLLDKQNAACVSEVFTKLKDKLGIKLYSKVFRVILTDNGSEFFNPLRTELDYNTGRRVCNLFYCEPYSSWQKGTIEKNHQYIRKIFPKGTSFDCLTDDIIKKLEDNINNTPRNELNGKTPYELTKKLYPDLLTNLNCSFILPDDVTLSKKDIIGEEND